MLEILNAPDIGVKARKVAVRSGYSLSLPKGEVDGPRFAVILSGQGKCTLRGIDPKDG